MFHHGYIFQTMLAEAGPLGDEAVRDHRTMQLLYGVNQAFKIRIEGTWQTVRLCLLDGNVPHYVNGEGDWQLCFYIYPDSHLGHLLKSSVLKESFVSSFSQDPPVAGPAVQPSVVRPVPPFELNRLFEKLIFLMTGRQAYPRPDHSLLRELRHHIMGRGIFSLPDLALACDIPERELADRFKRMTEFNVDSWLLHQRMMAFFNKRDVLGELSEDQLDSLARESGISGISGLDRLFDDLFGIAYTKWTGATIGSVVLADNRPEFSYFM